MPHFLVGDEQGQIKSLTYSKEPLEDGAKYQLRILARRAGGEQKSSVQQMAVNPDVGGLKAVVAGYSDGTVAVSTFQDEDTLQAATEWKDPRLKKDHSYIGLAFNSSKIYSCSSNGALELTTVLDPTLGSTPTHERTLLPTRLHDWKLSPDSTTFAYGGDEVELSVWNTEAAFQPRTEDPDTSTTQSKKRKRNDELFPGEVWRARNVANDALGLRQPIRITSLDYLSTSSSGHHIVTGTQFGDVRRYDTRAARRPMADWKGIGKVGGIQVVKKGLTEHELFVSDSGTNLFSVDLRNGRIAFGYKGLSGAVTSIAPSPEIMVSTANDRYARIHSTFPPPARSDQNLYSKGEVLDRVYVASVPTVAVWDGVTEDIRPDSLMSEYGDDVWKDMERVGETDIGTRSKYKRPHLS